MTLRQTLAKTLTRWAQKMAPSSGTYFNFRNLPNWWQLGFDYNSRHSAMASTAVYACINILSQEISRLHIRHYRQNEDGSRDTLTSTSAAQRMRRPNGYQTRSDWLMYMMQALLLDGNAYSVVTRDRRGAVSALHPQWPRSVQPYVVTDTGEVFYQLQQHHQDLSQLDEGIWVPQRDMLHIRLFTNESPVCGQTPLQACAFSISGGLEIQKQSSSFFGNMSRPGGILRSPKPLGQEAAIRLKQQWEEGLSGNFVGKTAVLDNDIDWKPLQINAVDSELLGQYKLSVEDIAMVYRVPLYLLGKSDKMSFNSIEQMQKSFIASGIGFYLEHFESALDILFDVPPNEMLEFDIERGLLRPELETRMSAYAKALQGGIYAPNEVRRKENLGPVEGGDEVYMQRQNWPLEALGSDAVAEESTEQAPDPEKQERLLRLVVNKRLESN